MWLKCYNIGQPPQERSMSQSRITRQEKRQRRESRTGKTGGVDNFADVLIKPQTLKCFSKLVGGFMHG
jgi:hypothetical protein